MNESDLENGRERREKHFWKMLEYDIIDLEEDVSMLPVRNGSLLQCVFVRFSERYGLFVSHASSLEEMDNLSEDIDEHLPFLEELDERKRGWVIPFLVEGGMMFLYDDWEKLNRHFDTITEHGIDGNPFFARVIEDTGAILRTNT